MIYTSKDELHTFYLHDCSIENIKINNRDMSGTIDYVNVIEENSLNQNTSAMETDKAVIIFKNYRLIRAVRLFNLVDGVQNRETLDALNEDEIASLLIGKQIFSYDYSKDKTRFEILCDNFTIVMDIEFDDVYVRWSKFVGKSWFEH